ncbi:hypothetical protein PCANC_25461 [Puccinia coronata f. sp. avenae]|uniref:Uncharacterized protein n=1 Tax=Puccinia coronata f. sp. avenae TaxID=200324 RepID=A0A2N5TXX2_9BASI|nr:hypothetical protein PCANC_25461 [Puccinia coronata f. sp. avenae]
MTRQHSSLYQSQPSQATSSQETQPARLGDQALQGTLQTALSVPNNGNRFNPLRGVSRTSSGEGQGQVFQAPRRPVNPNMFEQEEEELETKPVGEEDVFDDSDPEALGLYTAWPPLLPIGVEARQAENLQGLISLNEDHLQLVNWLMQTTPDSQWKVMVMMMASLIQRTGLAAGSNMVNDLAAANGPHQHVFSSAAHLDAQTNDFKSEHLPANWPANHVANQSVLGLMRVLLKHKRDNLQNLLLTNIKEFNRCLIDGPVPSLMNLLLKIDCAMRSQAKLFPLAAIQQAYSYTAKIRIAYLCLEVFHHFLNPDPASSLTQWDIINCNLEHLQRQSDLFCNAFARLVVYKDRELFGDQEFIDIPQDAIILPTNDKVHKEMARAAQTHLSSNSASIEELNDPDLFV